MYAHKVFTKVSPNAARVTYPLVSDRNQAISRAYRVLDSKGGYAMRGTVIISPEGIIKARSIYPPEVGRNAFEILRLIQGLQHNQQTGQGIPANWVSGQAAITPDQGLIGEV
ncbi:alkyl hydroperoxide reductase [Alkalihalophilus marmarensis DSM 21297]|uniref:Alkyl hydroperoxide reductase n=1 Tax=Alkalihalophilus marmarensis DSM 21297 TaxID=1188261 RepID=U6SMF8_9BACI|nr:alkyl hydroperoxide reductase [Alkalihalophilus marmarensis DSM 21297]